MSKAIAELTKAFIELGKAGFGAVKILTLKAFLIILTGIACFAGWIFQDTRLSLWSGPFNLVAWTAFLWLLAWLFGSLIIMHKGVKYAATLEVVVVCFIILQTFTSLAPGTTKAAALVAAHMDKQNLERAQMATIEVIHPFDCNKTNSEMLDYFGTDGTTGKPVTKIKYVLDKKNHVICFRQAGVYSKTGEMVKDVTADIIEMIEGQDPLVQQAAAPVAPAPQVAAQPIAVAEVTAAAPVVRRQRAPVIEESEPVAKPMHRAPQNHIVEAGETLTVKLDHSVEITGQEMNISGWLRDNLESSDNVLIATAGTPIDLKVAGAEKQGEHSIRVHLEAVSLTTTGGKRIDIHASCDRDLQGKSNFKKNVAIGGIGGAAIQFLHHDRRDRTERVLGSAAMGAAAGALLSSEKYVLESSQALQFGLETPLAIPATMLTSVQ